MSLSTEKLDNAISTLPLVDYIPEEQFNKLIHYNLAKNLPVLFLSFSAQGFEPGSLRL